MKIEIRDLLGVAQELQSPGIRIGWPDDPTLVKVADPRRFTAGLDSVLRAFRDLSPESSFLINVGINSYHRSVWIRVVRRGSHGHTAARETSAFDRELRMLHDIVVKDGGDLHYWPGNDNLPSNTYFDLSLPFRGTIRKDVADFKHLPWGKRYHTLLHRASWESLRGMVFRFSKLAVTFASRCAESGMSTVLIPSVGLCVHPWLFADRGLSVIATDVADSALSALSRPRIWPRLFCRDAFERWDIGESASYASAGHPDEFEGMPALEDEAIETVLRRRITFVLADWAALPLKDGSVDALFATNALPRDSIDGQRRVLREWIRLVRPGGLVFIAQHNFRDRIIEHALREAGWIETNILTGNRAERPDVTGFQTYYSSG